MEADEIEGSPETDVKLVMLMFDPETVGALAGPDPQPVYRDLQAGCPVLHRPGQRFTLLKMADILEVNRHPAVRGTGALDGAMGGTHKLIPLDLDGPRHRHYRKLLDPVFAPRKVAVLEPNVRRLADELIDGFVADGRTELHSSFCQPLPSQIFLSIMGIPLSDLDYFVAFKDGILRHDMDESPVEAEARREASRVKCREYFRDLWDERAGKETTEDIIGWLMSTEVEGERLDRDEFVEICFLLMIAGLDTVVSSLSCLLSWLARHPDERRWITADEQRWPLAIEELMRFESPVPQGFRKADQDIEIGGQSYEAGTWFMLSWSAANLDPDRFENPLTVDLQRQPNPHIVFASGAHRCLGSHLARLELRVALEQFHRRIPDYEIEPGTALQYLPLGVRQVPHLPIVWHS
jgi:cytochrome P450